MAVVIAAAFWLLFAISNQLLFFSPFLTFYWPLPSSSLVPFTLSTVIACLSGMVVSMNMHAWIIRNSLGKKQREVEEKKNMRGLGNRGSCASCNHRYRFSSILLSVSTVGVISGACAGCSFPVAPLFASSVLSAGSSGTIAASLFSFLSMYQIPIQLTSIVLLAWSYYHYHTSSKMLAANANRTNRTSCALDNKDYDDSYGDRNTSAVDDK